MNVSVVVPTFRRVELTRACLESIRDASAVDGVPVEIFIADSSPPPERADLQAICRRVGVTLLDAPASVSAKRNLGAECAHTEFVLFVDSDCVVAPGCLTAHLATLRDPSIHASQSTVAFRGPESFAFRVVRQSGILSALTPPPGESIHWAPSGNLMVRRDAFLSVKFDPALGPPGYGGEDVDFGLRFTSQGYRIVGTPAGLVHHDTATWNTFRANIARFFSWGRADVHLVERHRDSSYIDMPSPVHVMLLVALLSAIGAFWSSAALCGFPIGVLLFAGFMAVAGARNHPQDRTAGALAHWVFFMLDFGRFCEAVRQARPRAALLRPRFAADQITQEWPDLVPASWAVWLTLLVTIVFVWWVIA